MCYFEEMSWEFPLLYILHCFTMKGVKASLVKGLLETVRVIVLEPALLESRRQGESFCNLINSNTFHQQINKPENAWNS
jgi:hypothetical protein